MKSNHFTYDDAARKLSGCIVLYKDEPHYVRALDNARSNLSLTPIGKDFDKKSIKVHFNDESLDIAIPSLGYCNFDNNAFYLSRALGRINKQGISVDTLDSIPNRFPDDLIYSDAMRNTIKGIYPSFNQSLSLIKEIGGPCSVAFSRYLAIEYNGNYTLCYRTRKIGALNIKTKSLNIFPGEQASLFEKLLKELDIDYEVQ